MKRFSWQRLTWYVCVVEQKWSKGKVRDKLNNLILFDKATYEKLYKEVPNYKLITPAVVSERLKIRGSLARNALQELLTKGQSQLKMLNGKSDSDLKASKCDRHSLIGAGQPSISECVKTFTNPSQFLFIILLTASLELEQNLTWKKAVKVLNWSNTFPIPITTAISDWHNTETPTQTQTTFSDFDGRIFDSSSFTAI